MKARATPAAVPVCPVCGSGIPRGRLMCRAHWHQVPQPLQVDVWRTWQRFNHREASAPGALQRLHEYRAAADAATEYVVALAAAVAPVPPTAHQEQTT